ncbi:MAG: hypothetical protein AABW51_04715 [Nanoarchaeota archaeon]
MKQYEYDPNGVFPSNLKSKVNNEEIKTTKFRYIFLMAVAITLGFSLPLWYQSNKRMEVDLMKRYGFKGKFLEDEAEFSVKRNTFTCDCSLKVRRADGQLYEYVDKGCGCLEVPYRANYTLDDVLNGPLDFRSYSCRPLNDNKPVDEVIFQQNEFSDAIRFNDMHPIMTKANVNYKTYLWGIYRLNQKTNWFTDNVEVVRKKDSSDSVNNY